ncbi:MAG TPA: 1,6-anhydro-N-acetylmuramyl-L-alanine amidase AmpD [Steroidobacteraceae bacterium]|nr:1,6-anhydro-N-acetylmuramyl-L-alanine amidase AmpD [Steroidobacteraceae bacterium]
MGNAASVSVDVGRGLIAPARQVPSPNQDTRPPGASIDLVVVHGISLPPGEYGGPWVERLFLNTLPPAHHPFFATISDLRVSAHLFIRRDGELVQFVPFHARAWHAGASSWRHRVACNDFSIGIELEGDDAVPYEKVQYEALAAVVAALRRAYPTLAPDAITGHSDIAPGRKTDPGPAFDWPRLQTALAHAGAGA